MTSSHLLKSFEFYIFIRDQISLAENLVLQVLKLKAPSFHRRHRHTCKSHSIFIPNRDQISLAENLVQHWHHICTFPRTHLEFSVAAFAFTTTTRFNSNQTSLFILEWVGEIIISPYVRTTLDDGFFRRRRSFYFQSF